MHNPARLACILHAVAVLTSCDGSPTSPSPPAPAIGLTISGPGAIRTGFPTAYVATATLGNGRTETAQSAWTSSDPGVAAVDATGSVTGLAHGSITLTAAFRGATTSKTVDVVNDYQGDWTGTSVIRQCALSGDLEAGLRSYIWYWPTCDWLRGRVFEATLQLSQGGADLRQVSGSLDYTPMLVEQVGHYDVFGFVPLTGHVSDEGRLILAGAFVGSLGAGSAVDRWETALTTPGEMRGRWFQDFTTARPAIRVNWEAEAINWTSVRRASVAR